MLMDHDKKFVFIHIIKTAGTAIKHTLKPVCTNQNKIHVPAHMTAMECRDKFSKEFEEYFKFTFVRNPWDWEVSHYHYVQQSPSHPGSKYANSLTFDQWIQRYQKIGYKSQKSFIADESGKVMVDFVGKFESLLDDFDFIKEKLGVDVDLLRRMSSKHEHYTNYYSNDTKKLLEELASEDIQEFGYSYG